MPFGMDSCDFITYRHCLFLAPVLFSFLAPMSVDGSGNLLSACMDQIRYMCFLLVCSWGVLGSGDSVIWAIT